MGAFNLPTADIADPAKLDAAIEDSIKGADEVLVHCLFCQQRGPKAAAAISARLAELGLAEVCTRVKVIDGGYAAIATQFKDDKQLVNVPEGWTPPQH